ncbi:hypothetical protein M413DRAFT_396626 [Hebeloma cylindrosporum]|uniref:Amidohydrolase-related domain-containing protein n=1 Tax=Hebeloma cylindrosporum TaxID=76867 RepID=A0A0C2YQ56_HEBCY|nr:hypothetical protein M413DRAFT_396626 [Hebeloma cylindrosporum h7]
MASFHSDGNILIRNVRLPYSDKDRATKVWCVECKGGCVVSISPANRDRRPTGSSGLGPFEFEVEKNSFVDGGGGLMLPSFCHSHIHLDKCYILDRCGDLVKGNFGEAMKVTKAAKEEFPKDLDDLYARGARLIRQSVEHGVTAMRAHVEIDTSVGFACLEAALKLQSDFRAHSDVQIAIFAQEALFDSVDHQIPGENFALLSQAAVRHGVSVIGSAPYVEPSIEKAKKNIGLIFDLADSHGLGYVDFHLDYNLDAKSEPLIYEVIAQATRRYHTTVEHSTSSGTAATRPSCPRITIGHATRLQLFSPGEWRALADAISGLPITFVGLPQSDMYMQGREFQDEPLGAPRGTLRVPYLAQRYGIEIAMSVNNVDNAFTPQGSLDPLSLCSFGVGIFQAATPEDIRVLLRAVTLTSRIAITGTKPPIDLAPGVGDQADFVILHERQTLQGAVLDPPFDRTTIKGGRVVACRRSVRWFSDGNNSRFV